jgi:hypothetical protein
MSFSRSLAYRRTPQPIATKYHLSTIPSHGESRVPRLKVSMFPNSSKSLDASGAVSTSFNPDISPSPAWTGNIDVGCVVVSIAGVLSVLIAIFMIVLRRASKNYPPLSYSTSEYGTKEGLCSNQQPGHWHMGLLFRPDRKRWDSVNSSVFEATLECQPTLLSPIRIPGFNPDAFQSSFYGSPATGSCERDQLLNQTQKKNENRFLPYHRTDYSLESNDDTSTLISQPRPIAGSRFTETGSL